MPTESEFKYTPLEGGSFVIDSEAPLQTATGQSARRLIGASTGATSLSLFSLEIVPGNSRAWNSGESETILYVMDGAGLVIIGDRAFVVRGGCGVYVRANESFRFQPRQDEAMHVLAGACPPLDELLTDESGSTFFDGSQPERVVDSAIATKHPTDDRFYKLLAGPSIGCRNAMQFMGMIPRSKGPEHFHEYEEAICILSGEGRFWTGESTSAPVTRGSVIFLPRRQPHCLECTTSEGLTLVGLVSPASSPAVRYET